MTKSALLSCSLLLSSALTTSTLAQTPDNYGIEFVTVGAVNNAPFIAGPFPLPSWPVSGRGSVAYEYRIGKYEITTGQWMEFMNTFSNVEYEDRPPFFNWFGPNHWGAERRIAPGGQGFRYILNQNIPNAEMLPVFGISWRDAGLYCNWLHNGKSADPASLLTGAYNVASWGPGPVSDSITDDPTHMPGAKYWIPTLDEQIKAFHYDPHRYGPGLEGYWLNMNGRDVDGTPGLPGVGQTSAGWVDPDVYAREREIPLGAYPSQVSPWGLYDTSGGTMEWNELMAPRIGLPSSRGLHGAHAGSATRLDSIYTYNAISPSQTGIREGFRIASAIPSPGCLSLLISAAVFAPTRKRTNRNNQ